LADVFDTYAHPIKLILSDLDGTITTEELKPIDCEGLRALRRNNERSRLERDVPPLSIATGRPHSYLEAFCRFLSTPLPSLFESGCGLHLPADPLGRDYFFHPALQDPAVKESCRALEAWAERELMQKRGAGFIIGKEYAISYTPGECCSVDDLLAAMKEMPAELADRFFVTRSSAVVDITPKPVDKGVGVAWLLSFCRERLGLDIQAANVVGIGDSYNDLPLLDQVGVPCAVANATAAVKARVAYVAEGRSAAGVEEIAERAIALNRRLGWK